MKEKDQISAWKNEAQNTLNSINALVDNAIDGMKDYKAYDKNKAYESITGESLEPKVKRLNWWKLAAISSVAASFLIVFFINNANKKEAFVQQTFVGEEKVKLISLKDNSNVFLDDASTLIYKEERKVSLKGQAFFQVTSTQDKDNFEIEIDNGKITVLGTKFSVLSTSNNKEVAVEEGKVKFQYKDQETIITNNQKAVIIDDKIVIEQNKQNQFAWKSGKLIFKDTPIMNAINDIQDRYKVNISIKSNVKFSNSCLITSKFENESIDEVMNELKILFNITYTKDGKNFTITSGKC
jgi:ferric-dicitrate binding protein FerR (iron transport regulator)